MTEFRDNTVDLTSSMEVLTTKQNYLLLKTKLETLSPSNVYSLSTGDEKKKKNKDKNLMHKHIEHSYQQFPQNSLTLQQN